MNVDTKIIAENLRWAKDHDCSTAVLLGSGASVSAGIPAAQGMVQEIKRQFPRLTTNCRKKDYASHMALLTPAQRKDLIGSFVDHAKINWAHLYLGALVKGGYVDRVLTTNFDPLVIRSLALFNLYPAVYDFAASQTFVPGGAAELSVFYLHGQRDGFVLLNTKERMREHSRKLKDVFQDVARKRCWLVVGYSGESDPVFDRLAEIEVFESKLFWIGYENLGPPKHVLERILQPSSRHGCYLGGYDADDFFDELAKELNLPEPQIISRPFSHLKEAINGITEQSIKGQSVDPTAETKKIIDSAIELFEEGKSVEDIRLATRCAIKRDRIIRQTRDIWLNDRFKGIDKVLTVVSSSGIAEASVYLAIALNNWGVTLSRHAETKIGVEKKTLLKKACNKYKQALRIKPDYAEALDNWGAALSDLAVTTRGRGREALLKKAISNHEGALTLKPGYYQALTNWGVTLSRHAETKIGVEKKTLLKEACNKYKQALRINPDYAEAFRGLGSTLLDIAREKKGKKKELSLNQALKNLLNAEALKERLAAYNIACVYSLKGKKEKSLEWLEKTLKQQPVPTRKYILADRDLDNVKDAEDFWKLVDEHRPDLNRHHNSA